MGCIDICTKAAASRYNLLDICRHGDGLEKIISQELSLIQRNKNYPIVWHGICLNEGISSLLSPEKAGLSAETGFFLFARFLPRVFLLPSGRIIRQSPPAIAARPSMSPRL